MSTMNAAISSPSVTAPDNYSYRERRWRAPSVPSDAEIIFDEPGRVLDNVCYRSHYFRVSKDAGLYSLHVKHGGGEETWRIGYARNRFIEGFASLDSDARFMALWVIADAHLSSYIATRDKVNAAWRKAAAEKRIKTRKVKDGVKVWIEPEVLP